ncbi:MAG TPA: rhodanese-like domain-containing protein, partial [Mycobacteriales bacterium]|nr:rhodanese-like domain-containing protein [Mycobacteriales bacterium]
MNIRSLFRPAGLPGVSATDARRLMADGAVLVDVREPSEWDAGHAPGARHVPLATVLSDAA